MLPSDFGVGGKSPTEKGKVDVGLRYVFVVVRVGVVRHRIVGAGRVNERFAVGVVVDAPPAV